MSSIKLYKIIDELDDLIFSLAIARFTQASSALVEVKFLVLKELNDPVDYYCHYLSNGSQCNEGELKGINNETIVGFPKFFRSDLDVDLLEAISTELHELGLVEASNEMSTPILLILLQESTVSASLCDRHIQFGSHGRNIDNVIDMNKWKSISLAS